MSVKIIKSGILSTIQDLGRKGYQRFGIIESGAMDAFACKTANILVGNDINEAVVEMTLIGPTIQFKSNALVAICGGDFTVKIDGEEIPQWRPVLIRKDSILEMGGAKRQIRAYLAVAGGFDIPIVMGSFSTYLRASIGGFRGRKLRTGDVLRINRPIHKSFQSQHRFVALPKYIANHIKPAYASNNQIRVLRGSEFDLFTEKSKEQFFSHSFKVLLDSDRMGYRLKGLILKLHEEMEMSSAAVSFGTIQVPANGNPIILMADHQTTGGYPKIAQVISVDLPLLAQMNFGSNIQFVEVSLKESQHLLIKREKDLQILMHVMKKELNIFLGAI